MNFGIILGLIFKLAIPTILTIQQVHGQAVSGADKKTLAMTALTDAAGTALSLFPADSANAAYTTAAATFASTAIDFAVSLTKLSGAYQKATPAPSPTPA